MNTSGVSTISYQFICNHVKRNCQQFVNKSVNKAHCIVTLSAVSQFDYPVVCKWQFSIN